MTVNKERVRLLVDALRSGEFQQGVGVLRNPDIGRYCCLGVATEVALRNGLVISPLRHPDSYPWRQSHQVMCEPVAEWYGLPASPKLLRFAGEGNPREAVIWNDELGADFQAIADGFERTYLTDEAPAA